MKYDIKRAIIAELKRKIKAGIEPDKCRQALKNFGVTLDS